MPYTISELNQADQDAFVAALGAIFEHTPAIAAKAWTQRPFADRDVLYQAMVAAMQNLSSDEQFALICAHPDLGSRIKMAEASVKEQAGAGLDQLSPAEYQQFQQLNQAYKAKFGFPFIIAVRNHTRTSIVAAFQHRLQNSIEAERQQALREIAEIARLRLFDLVADY